jgi:hypothetical protein
VPSSHLNSQHYNYCTQADVAITADVPTGLPCLHARSPAHVPAARGPGSQLGMSAAFATLGVNGIDSGRWATLKTTWSSPLLRLYSSGLLCGSFICSSRVINDSVRQSASPPLPAAPKDGRDTTTSRWGVRRQGGKAIGGGGSKKHVKCAAMVTAHQTSMHPYGFKHQCTRTGCCMIEPCRLKPPMIAGPLE